MLNCTPLKENLDKLELGSKTIYLIGSAHISQQSADLAQETIREIKPNCVAVELCDSRLQSLKDPNRWRNTDIMSVIRSGRGYVLLAQLMLSSFQKKLGSKINVVPGAEMLRSVEAAEEVGAQVVCADRAVRTTLKRVWASLGFWSSCKVLAAMVDGLLSSQKLESEEIERLKSSAALDELMKEFSSVLPEIRKSLIDERDQYLAQKIKNSPGETVVAVVGAAHVPGIKLYLEREIDLAPLDQIPPKSITSKVFSWGIPGLVVLLLVLGCLSSGFGTSVEMAWLWFIIHGVLAAIGAIIALAHPLTIIATFFAAPFTALHPLIGVGWVSALVEAFVRKPRVSDLETISDDLASVKGIWTNRVSRIFLIMILTSLGGSLGTLIGLKQMFSLL